MIPLVIRVKNCGISKKDECIYNRIECNTNYDFNNITQIMISPPIKYPHKEEFFYSNLILLTKNTKVPLIVPYLYQEMPENSLENWLFINEKGERFLHKMQ